MLFHCQTMMGLPSVLGASKREVGHEDDHEDDHAHGPG